jgi:hypothetical protein
VFALGLLYFVIGFLSIKPICIREMRNGYKFKPEDFNFFIPAMIVTLWPMMWPLRPLGNYINGPMSDRHRRYEMEAVGIVGRS